MADGARETNGLRPGGSVETISIEGALVPLKSFRDILEACEEMETAVPPIAVGVVLDALLRDFEREVSMAALPPPGR